MINTAPNTCNSTNTPSRTKIIPITLTIASLLLASCRDLNKETIKLERMIEEYKQVAIEHNAQVKEQQSWCDQSIQTEINASWEWLNDLDNGIDKQKKRVIRLQKKETKKNRKWVSWGSWSWTNYNQNYEPNRYDYYKKYKQKADDEKARQGIKNSRK